MVGQTVDEQPSKARKMGSKLKAGGGELILACMVNSSLFMQSHSVVG